MRISVLALAVCAQSWWSLSLGGCVDIDGGAIEFSWALRNFDGEKIDCLNARIDEVSLCWRDTDLSGDTTCAPDSSADFVCEREQGATAFEVPPGKQTLWIQASCSTSGALADVLGYDVPAPIVRTVTDGDIVTLNTLLIVASDTQVASECGSRPCTCPP